MIVESTYAHLKSRMVMKSEHLEIEDVRSGVSYGHKTVQELYDPNPALHRFA
jgi:hypothetical protein